MKDPLYQIEEHKWKLMEEFGLQKYFETDFGSFSRRMKRGVPMKFRWEAWKVALGYSAQYTEGVYSSIYNVQNRFSPAIQIDTPRTFSDKTTFDKPCQQSLFRVLNAFVNVHPTIGYFQGMNFVAGILLIVSGFNEEETFWALHCMIFEFGLKGFFQDRFPLLSIYTDAFDELSEQCVPELKAHFDSEGIESSIFLHQWLLTMFVTTLPLETTIILWDFILIKGVMGLLQISIAILHTLQPVLILLDFEDTLRFLKSLRKGATDDSEPEPLKLLVPERMKEESNELKLSRYQCTTECSDSNASTKLIIDSGGLTESTQGDCDETHEHSSDKNYIPQSPVKSCTPIVLGRLLVQQSERVVILPELRLKLHPCELDELPSPDERIRDKEQSSRNNINYNNNNSIESEDSTLTGRSLLTVPNPSFMMDNLIEDFQATSRKWMTWFQSNLLNNLNNQQSNNNNNSSLTLNGRRTSQLSDEDEGVVVIEGFRYPLPPSSFTPTI